MFRGIRGELNVAVYIDLKEILELEDMSGIMVSGSDTSLDLWLRSCLLVYKFVPVK